MLRFAIKVMIFVAATATLLSAQEISPGQASVKTQHYSSEFFDLAEGTYSYDISWQGISVANGEISIDEQELSDGPFVQVHAKAWTGGAVAALYRLRHDSASLFNSQSFAPKEFHSIQKENSKTQYRQIYFRQGGLIESDRWREGKVRDPRVSFQSDNLTFDPITAIFYARSLPMDIGVERNFDVYTARHRFLITLKVESLEWIKMGMRQVRAYKVVPKVKKLTEEQEDKKFRRATIWVSADQRRDILKLESEVWVGSIVAELTKFEPKVIPQLGAASLICSSWHGTVLRQKFWPKL